MQLLVHSCDPISIIRSSQKMMKCYRTRASVVNDGDCIGGFVEIVTKDEWRPGTTFILTKEEL